MIFTPPSTFQKNVIHRFGIKGEQWLETLNSRIKSIKSKWKINEIDEIKYISNSYILFGKINNEEIAIKMSPNFSKIRQEAFVLDRLKNRGAVALLDQEEGVLLLKRAIPGQDLGSYYQNDEKSIEVCCEVLNKIHNCPLPAREILPNVYECVKLFISKLEYGSIHYEKAKKIFQILSETRKPDLFLHGDLHQKNIILDKKSWIFIDPQGVIGEADYDVLSFITYGISSKKIEKYDSIKLIEDRIKLFSQKLNLDESRIRNWIYLKSILFSSELPEEARAETIF